jgi:hypothetical protein
MRVIVKGVVAGTLALAVLVGSPALSLARPKKPLNLCACKCRHLGGEVKGYGSVLSAGACSEFTGISATCVDKAGKKFEGRLEFCQHKGTVATGLTPGTGGVLQPPENAPTGGVKPSPVTPGQTQR